MPMKDYVLENWLASTEWYGTCICPYTRDGEARWFYAQELKDLGTRLGYVRKPDSTSLRASSRKNIGLGLGLWG